jgi:hypothetical protein
MTETDIKNVMYGSIRELVQNRNYFYDGYRPRWTDEGKRLLLEMMDMYASKILESIKEDDEQRSRDLVLKDLTK